MPPTRPSLRRRPAAALLVLLGASPAAQAAPFSLQDALEQAIAASPSLRAAELAVDAAAAARQAQAAAFDPVASASSELGAQQSASYLGGFPTTSTNQSWSSSAGLAGSLASGTDWSLTGALGSQRFTTTTDLGGQASANSQTAWTGSAQVSLRQDLLVLLRPTDARAALRKASEALDIATTEALATRQEGLAAVAEDWWAWSQAAAAAGVAERAVAQATALAAVTRVWVEEGAAEPVELARVEAERLAAELAAAEARDAVDDARDVLLVRIGRRPGAELEPAGAAPAIGETGDGATELAAQLDRVRAASPSLAALRARVAAAEAATRDVRWDRLPSLQATGSAGLASLEDSADTAVRALTGTDRLPSWSAGLALELPLGGRAARARQDSAAVALQQARLELAAAERSTEAELRAALRSLRTAAAAVSLAGQRVEVARETEAGEQARVEAGSRRLDELLSATTDRENAELDEIQAQRDLWSAQLELARLSGRVDAALAAAPVR